VGGLYYEDFEVGSVIEHPLRRTLSEMDNVLFSTLTLNPQPLHLDEEFSKQTPYGQRLVNSIFTLGLTVGIAVMDTTLGTTLGNLGFEDVTFPKPVFHGDTLRAETEILDKRESKSRTDSGIVFFGHRAHNQRGELICQCRRAGLMMKRPVAEAAR
jgi:acyl dehydratase